MNDTTENGTAAEPEVAELTQEEIVPEIRFLPFSESELGELSETDLDKLAELDSHGLMPEPGETFEAFIARLQNLETNLRELDSQLRESGKFRLLDEVDLDGGERISPEIMHEAGEITRNAYGFEIDWTPGFFLSKNIGPLWGGCAFSFPDDNIMVFLIRSSFKTKRRWLIYRRDELLSHELCHTARMPLHDRKFEEFFAYRISYSRFRRFLGPCFYSRWDAALFLLPLLPLLGVQIYNSFTFRPLPSWPFWIVAGIYPAFLIIRNLIRRRRYFQAETALRNLGIVQPAAVLFRSTSPEIAEISKLKKSPEQLKKYLEEKSESELRWKIINFRFINPPAPEPEATEGDHDHEAEQTVQIS